MAFLFLITVLQICSTRTLAFQFQHTVITHSVHKRSTTSNFLKMNLSTKEEQHQQQIEEGKGEGLMSQSQRRDFLRNSLSLLLTTSTVISSSNKAEASSTSGYIPDMVGGYRKPSGVGGLTKKIRKVGNIMDELQRDLMQEKWDLVEKYPDQLRSFVPVFTTYTDSAFPTDAPTDGGLRVALRYEVGRFFASTERLKQATSRRALNEAYLAYSDMALHFDRYLHVGGLYTYYDATISNEDFFKGVSRDSLVYSNPKTDPALVRDLVVLTTGPDMGKTGIVIGIYSDGSNNCVVKLDRYMGLREIRVVPKIWAAKRLGEQDPDDVFLITRKDN